MSTIPTAPRPGRARARRLWIVPAVLAVLVAFGWAFDWNWLRPALRHYVTAHSGRRFDCGDLKVRFHGSAGQQGWLDPTIEMRDVFVQNATWAASREPFLHAGFAAVTISWRTIGSDMLVLDMIVLRDAEVDMERQANGLRNWRISHPDDIGPPHVRVLALDAQRSQLHVVHAGIGLVGDGRLDALAPQPPVAGHADLPLTKRLVFDGSYQGHAFAIDAAVSDILPFGGTARRFALRGVGHLGGLRVDGEGVASDVHALEDLSVDARLASSGDGPLWPLPPALARVRPLAAHGHVEKVGTAWTGTGVQAALGRRTAFAGDVRFVGSIKDPQERRIVDATLHDVVLDVADLRALADRPVPAASAASAAASAAGFALSTTPLPAARLREFDAEVDLKDARIVDSPDALAQSLRGHVTLAAGVLRATALDLGAAGGHVTGSFQFDASRDPVDLAVDLHAHGLELAQLAPRLASRGAGGIDGRLDARAQLHAQGDSVRALAAAATGSVGASLETGASVSKRLDAKLSLDGGEWLRSLFDKSARVPVQCAALTLAVGHGRGTSRHFEFETEHTALAGHGTVDVLDETLDATLTPARKTQSLLALDKSIHVHGPWRDLHHELEPPAADAAPERCTAH